VENVAALVAVKIFYGLKEFTYMHRLTFETLELKPGNGFSNNCYAV